MANLAEVVRALRQREGVEAVVVVSGDGLPIDQVGGEAGNADALAALTVTLAREAGRLSDAASRGDFTTAVLEYDRGLAIVARLGSEHWLLLLVAGDVNVGPLLHQLRRHRPALTAFL